MKNYDVIIVNYNGEKIVKECLDSVYSSSVKPSSVIIYDNNSQDNSVETIKNLKLQNLTIIEGKQNIGFGPGNNEALKKSRSDFVLFINNDILLDKNCVKSMLEFISDKKLAVVNPLIIKGWDKSKEGEIYSFGANINKACFGYSLIENRLDRSNLSCFSGACFLADRRVIRSIGFEKKFFMYYEEIAISIELLKKGFKIGRTSEAKCYHLESYSSPKNQSQGIAFRQYNGIQNRWYLLGKHWPARLLPYALIINLFHLVFFCSFFIKIRQYKYLKLFLLAPAKFIRGSFDRSWAKPKIPRWFLALKSDSAKNFFTLSKKVLVK
jgi:GT2 family glycosyltransferase